MAENKEELKSVLIRVKEESERAGLRLNIKKKKSKIMESGPIQLILFIYIYIYILLFDALLFGTEKYSISANSRIFLLIYLENDLS